VTVLLVGGDDVTMHLLATAFRATTRPFDLVTVGSVRAGLDHLARHAVDCVVVDHQLSNGDDALACVQTIQRDHPTVPVVMLTARDAEDDAASALQLGACDYVVKDGRRLFTLPAVVEDVLRRPPVGRPDGPSAGAPDGARAAAPAPAPLAFEGIVGTSQAMMRAVLLGMHAARSRATVLIEGETGTGKELLARAIHRSGARATGPFVAENCAALSETLLETELFGHLRGAFTGADRDRRGLLEQAHGGTLLLDEVGEMSPALQAKLLRVLQDGRVRPVGGSSSREVDVRVIAATNRNLREAAENGRFRPDLYYRLCICPIRLPPLRERPEDIPLLATHFLDIHCRQEGKVIQGFEPGAMAMLVRHAWPGNVRELENEVQRLVVFGENGRSITAGLISPWVAGSATPPRGDAARPLKEILREVERQTVTTRLREHGYHRAATARSLGITRETLWAKVRQFGLTIPRPSRST
jgi:two-component system response regulator HydG